MQGLPAVLLVAGLAAAVLGLPLGLYALLTRDQRRTTREIRLAAAGRGWRYRQRRWQGNPTAFRIDGQTQGGLPWVLTSGSSGGYDRGWSNVLSLRFPTLGGEADFSVEPRDLPQPAILKDATGFEREAREFPSDLPDFDAAYKVLASPGRISRPPVDDGLAARMVHWPPEAIAPHSILAWRGPFSMHLQFRLPAPPNWTTVANAVEIGEALAGRVPAANPIRK
ncbi:MAG TPA: hypothetical protein VKR61_17935 [Bryobacteraceae bacterium]|nr:hypothetical protein [Bryobacteraceae bacterium]